MNPLNIEQIMEEFKVRSERLFTNPQTGLCVVLDYPPHDKVLDSGLVEQWLRSKLQSLLLEAERRILDKENIDHWAVHCKQVLRDMAQTK